MIWEQLDRVLGYRIPWGDRARAGLMRLTEQLDQHLGMVFHRFLSQEAGRRKKLSISINGTAVEPWDPFARDEQHTITFEQHQFELQGDYGKGLVGYTGYVVATAEQILLPQSLSAMWRAVALEPATGLLYIPCTPDDPEWRVVMGCEPRTSTRNWRAWRSTSFLIWIPLFN